MSLGTATSVVFDLRSTTGSKLWVELEQPGIADGVNHASAVPIGNDLWNRVRIPLSSFVQPGTGRGLWAVEVLDMSGRVLGRRRLVWLGGTLQAGFPGLTLGSGGYFPRHRSADRSIAGPFVIP